MVILRLSKFELQQLILWGDCYKDKSSQLLIPFEADEELLLKKLRGYRDKKEVKQ